MKKLRLPGRSACEEITLWGNPVLRTPATPVTVFDKRIRLLVSQMFETMYAIETGVGLAANQIGRSESVFVFDCQDDVVGHVINPVIEVIGAEIQDGDEGCLSLPGHQAPTIRFQRCRVRGQDERGNVISYEGQGLRSRAFQHEADHLKGGLYIDHLNDDIRREIEADMRSAEWYGSDSLDPTGELYKRHQDD